MTVKEQLEAAGVEFFTVKGPPEQYCGYAPLDLLKKVLGRPRGVVDGRHRWEHGDRTYVFEIATGQLSFRK